MFDPIRMFILTLSITTTLGIAVFFGSRFLLLMIPDIDQTTITPLAIIIGIAAMLSSTSALLILCTEGFFDEQNYLSEKR